MRYYLFILFTMLLAGLQISNAFAATPIKGVVTAKRGDSLKVEFQFNTQAAPQPGDHVEFYQMLDGYPAEAGTGKVIKNDGDAVWVQTNDSHPDLTMNALIHATGGAIQNRQQQVPNKDKQTVNSNVIEDNGWSDVKYQKVDPVDHYINAIVRANQSCNYQQALQIADQARNEIPDNAWINQNYPTIKILARRGTNYQKALNTAYQTLEKGEVAQSISYMKVAMQNASVTCGQDKKILSLLDQAKLISKMAREETIEKARQQSVQNAQNNHLHRAKMEKKRVEREAFGQALSGSLLGLLRAVNSSGGSSSYLNNIPNSSRNEDIFSKMTRDNTNNNKDILNKWRKSQGWSTIPDTNTSGSVKSGNNTNFQNSQQSQGDDQIRQMVKKMNENETLKKWYKNQSQGWPAKPSSKKMSDSGWE